MTSADVVERVYRQVRSVLGCPKPSPALLRAVVEYVVDRVMHTRGEVATITVAPIRRRHPHERISAKCIPPWLGVEDCVFERKGGKVILYVKCVREKLGLV